MKFDRFNDKIIFLVPTVGLILVALIYFLYASSVPADQNNTIIVENGKSPSPTSMQSPQPTVMMSPSPIPDNWERSTDVVAGYSMAHPQDWFVEQTNRFNGESRITSFSSQNIGQAGPVPQGELKVSVVRFLPTSTVTPDEPSEDQIESETEVTIAGVPATRRVINRNGRSISISFTYQNDQYIITAIPANSEYISIFDQMVSSFQFVPKVSLTTPDPLQAVSSPLQIEGTAPGTWFFEGQLSARLETNEGRELGTTSLQTSEEWMTEQEISFSGELEFTNPNNVENAVLVLSKANPSGLPQNAREVRMNVKLE